MILPGPIGRDPAQRLARQELSKGIYHQTSFLQRIWDAISHFLGNSGQAVPGGWWTLVALAAIVAAAIGFIVVRLGPIAGAARRSSPLGDPGGRPMTAGEFRESARNAAADGDFSTAIVQCLRAVAADCEERGILAPDAVRTADEFAAQAGVRFPGHAADLASAAALFDHIRYGDGTGTREGYERLRDLDNALRRVSPAGEPAAAAAGVTRP